MTKTFPARVHVILAKNSPNAVVIRRGPSKQVCTFLWNRETDEITIGQWLKGRIYERRCDLSSNGEYFIYFAMNGKWDSETKGSWTAVSKAPFLKALDLHAKGDCWEGGGLFLDKNTYWLNDTYFNPDNTLMKSLELNHKRQYQPKGKFGSECTGVYYRRLIRDGWELIERKNKSKWKDVTTFVKPMVNGWQLTKLAHEEVDSPEGKGCYWDEHILKNTVTGAEFIKDDWEWAELDLSLGRESVIWASDGCLYRASLQDNLQLTDVSLVHDFNPYTFENIIADY